MAKTKATDRLTIKGLSADDQAWLQEESERLGCDPENLVRMMIRQRSAAVVVPVGPSEPPRERYQHGYNAVEAQREYESSLRVDDRLASETVNESPDLDQLMSEPPSIVESAIPPRPRIIPFQPASGKTYRVPATPNVKRALGIPAANYPGGAFGAFTETEFVGMDQSILGANMMGDGVRNVMRDNLRHFGVAGTRNR